MESVRLRRAAGIWIGGLLGTVYGLVSQLVNAVALVGVPLYRPPLGLAGNILLFAVLGALLGALCAWPSSAALGIGLSSVLAAILLVRWGLVQMGVNAREAAGIIFGVVLSVPLAWLAVPALGLIRWAAGRHAEATLEGMPLLPRFAVPLLLALLLGLLALFELQNGDARSQLRRTNDLVQAGLSAGSRAALPDPLRGPHMGPFPPPGTQRYALEWTDRDLDRFIELRPSANYDQHAAVIAHFDGGYTLVCLYPTVQGQPNCGSY